MSAHDQRYRCESLILQDALKCPEIERNHCTFKLVKKHENCHLANESICKVIDRIINFPLQTRLMRNHVKADQAEGTNAVSGHRLIVQSQFSKLLLPVDLKTLIASLAFVVFLVKTLIEKFNSEQVYKLFVWNARLQVLDICCTTQFNLC